MAQWVRASVVATPDESSCLAHSQVLPVTLWHVVTRAVAYNDVVRDYTKQPETPTGQWRLDGLAFAV